MNTPATLCCSLFRKSGSFLGSIGGSALLLFIIAFSAQTTSAAVVTRGPYLQSGSWSNVIVRWRTDEECDGLVRFGPGPTNLNRGATNLTVTTEHEVRLTGLATNTKYFYAIGASNEVLAGDATFSFVTAPSPGTQKPTRIWAIGDFGTRFQAQYDVRNAYTNFTATNHTDVWLMLGDNAYGVGADAEYQAAVFEAYPELLRKTLLYPTLGNHETYSSEPNRESSEGELIPPYLNIFTLPKFGEAGGFPSGTENYYSFDYANIHFVCLDSMISSRQPGSPMLTWLENDLQQTTGEWIIAYFHHGPYTMGSHNSDREIEHIEMRQYAAPILERYGVDLVLSGHSHNYERSYLLDGHYGLSDTFDPTNMVSNTSGRTNDGGPYLKPWGGLGARNGTVYVIDGTSGGQFGFWNGEHPAFFYKTLDYGSLVIDVISNRLNAIFLRDTGAIDDSFTIIKGDYTNAPRPRMDIARSGQNVTISWPTSIPDYRLEGRGAIHSNSVWSAVDSTILINGRRKNAVVPKSATNQFFRLRSTP